MVLRIIRRGICRPSKFRRPKHNPLLERLKGTASGEEQNKVTGCTRCQGVNGSLGTQFNDPSNLRPTLHIAHSTVFAEAKGDDNDSLTLLESLRQRLASHNIHHNISVVEPAKLNEAKEEISDETEEGRHEFSKDTVQVEETVRATISDADNAKNHEHLEPGDERRAVFDPPHIKSYTRYLQQTEKHNQAQMFDELARKYLVTEKGEIDKPLSQDMERLGLPVNTSEAMRPPVNVYFSGEVESREEHAPKPSESAKTEPTVESSAYYEKANWCNNYFIDTPKETVLAFARANKEMAEENADKFRRDALHNDMLPLNWCYDSYFNLKNSDKEASNVAKLQFYKHDDMLAFHLLQCKEFIDLDLTVKSDPVESPVQELKVEEDQPIHYNIPISPKATHPKESSDTIIKIQSQTVSRTQKEQSSQQAEPLLYTNTAGAKIYEEGAYQTSQTVSKTQEEQSSQEAEPLLYTNTAETKVHEQGAFQTTNETEMNILHMSSQRTTENQGQKSDEGNPLENIIHAKVLEQVQGVAAQKMERCKRSGQSPHTQSKDETQNMVKPKLFTDSKMVGYNTAEEIEVSEKTKDYSLISQDTRAAFNKAPAEPTDTTQDSPQTSRESQAIVQSLNQAHAEQTDESRSTVESLQSSQERQAIVPSYFQAHEQQVNESPYYTKQSQAMIENSNQVQEVPETLKAQNTEHPEHLAHTTPTAPKVAINADVAAEEMQPTKGSEAMTQSCVQAGTEAVKIAEPAAPNKVTNAIDDALKKLNLDSNLSLSELLRRVRARNRLQYYNDIRTYMVDGMAKRCPPSDRPEAPCPPDCAKPCGPRPTKPKKHKKRKCPKPKKRRCPKPKKHRCPKPKCPKRKPAKKRCPPPPPTCPPKPKKCPNPCPCPAPKCPPQPPKCPCNVADLNDSVIPLCFFNFFESTSSHIKHLIGSIKQGVMESRERLFATCSADPDLETDALKLNRVKDFEPWTPIPSWPYPVHDKKRMLQCPYHGCPHHKPGPVYFTKKKPTVSYLEEPKIVHHEAPLLARSFCKTEWMKPRFVDKPYTERQEQPLLVQTTRRHDKIRYGDLGRVRKSHNDLYKTLAKNGNLSRIFSSLALCDPGRTKGTNSESKDTKQSDDGKLKRHEVEAIIQTYTELKACTTPHVKKSCSSAEVGVEPAIETATLKATTANLDEAENLKQKLETIEEVPLVEADADIIKPPRASGPNVMNITDLKNCEEDARNSDFQIGEDYNSESEAAVYSQTTPNYIKHYFEGKEGDPSRKPNLNEMVSLHAVPEIKMDENLSLKELMERIRQRNRLLRCREIDQQLNTTSTTIDMSTPKQPNQSPPTIQPGWNWPQYPGYSSPNYPGYRPSPYPYVSDPSPQKAEPITPDNRPRHCRATKVDPVSLALHLGPLVDAFKNASILLPLVMAVYLFPKTASLSSGERQRNFCCDLRAVVVTETEDLPSDIEALD